MTAGQAQELLFGVASQSLVLESPRPLASVSSCSLFEANSDDTGTAESATSGNPAVGSAVLSTTSDAAAGASQTDPRKVSVVASAGFVVGRRYYISKAGAGEAFELARNDTANNDLYARQPLLNDYATGATVADSLRATQAVTDAWCAERGNVSANLSSTARYRARWVVTYATLDGTTGATDVLYTNVDLLRYASAPPVSPLDVDAAFPGWLDGLDPDSRDTQGDALIREAVRLVKIDLLRGSIPDQAIRNAEVHSDGVIRRCVYERVKSNAIRGGASDMQVRIAHDHYREWLDGLIAAPVVAIDPTGGGGAKSTTASTAPLFARSR